MYLEEIDNFFRLRSHIHDHETLILVSCKV